MQIYVKIFENKKIMQKLATWVPRNLTFLKFENFKVICQSKWLIPPKKTLGCTAINLKLINI